MIRSARPPGQLAGDTAFPMGATPPYQAVIFDMDGVVTDTASLHAAAWKDLFDAAVADPRARSEAEAQPFDVAESPMNRWSRNATLSLNGGQTRVIRLEG